VHVINYQNKKIRPIGGFLLLLSVSILTQPYYNLIFLKHLHHASLSIFLMYSVKVMIFKVNRLTKQVFLNLDDLAKDQDGSSLMAI